MMLINNKFNIRDKVKLITDDESLIRIVTGLIIREGVIIYFVTQGATETSHYDYEMELVEEYKETV